MSYTKSLGSESAHLITSLSNIGQSVFSITEAQKVSGKGYSVVVQELRRLTKSGWVVKLSPGTYALVPLSAGSDAIPEANRLVIARALMEESPYYLSHDSALEIHNMLTRPVTTVTVTTPRRLRNRTILNVPYRFIYSNPDDLWGYAPVWAMPNEQVQVSDMEKTILDGLARPDLCSGISEVATGLWIRKDDLDWEKLTAYAQKMGSQSVIKRLGYLSELFELGTSHVNKLQEMIGPSYAMLDPILPAEGAYLARWRLRINIEPEILKRIGTT